MNTNTELLQISRITDQIFLSGIFPLEINPEIVNQMGITHILSCVNNDTVEKIQGDILLTNPNLTIMTVNYKDNVSQNLWNKNKNFVNLKTYPKNIYHETNLEKFREHIHDKPCMEICYKFIDNVVKSGGKILIHCMAGVSRSASVTIYYFMKKNNKGYYPIYREIKQKRQIIRPNKSFVQQLLKYDDMRGEFTVKMASRIVAAYKNN